MLYQAIDWLSDLPLSVHISVLPAVNIRQNEHCVQTSHMILVHPVTENAESYLDLKAWPSRRSWYFTDLFFRIGRILDSLG
jgi:hypothetical protein